jgi:3-hydroxyisobutyrate dehydrogenase-like beta-hydroxyacid dehydrogenase
VPIGGGKDDACPRSIGILGLEAMGLAVARRLLLSRPVGTIIVGYGTPTEKLAQHHLAGALLAVSAADLAARSEVIVVMLDDPAVLEAALAGPSGLVAGVHSPTTLIVGSAMPPDELRRLGRDLADATAGLLRIVDAPLAGSAASVAHGTLSILVGAGIASYERVRPVLDLLGSSVRVGPLGAGLVATAANQLVTAAIGMALGEAAVLAQRGGLELGRALGAWQNSAVARLVEMAISADAELAASGPAEVSSRPTGSMLPWLRLAEREATRTGTRADLLAALLDLYEELAGNVVDDADVSITTSFVAGRLAPIGEALELPDPGPSRREDSAAS